MKLIGSLLCITFALVGCATPPQMTEEYKKYYEDNNSVLQKEGVTVQASSCIARYEIGDRYYLVKPAQDIKDKAKKELSAYLQKNQINVIESESNILCAQLSSLDKDKPEKIEAATEIGEQRKAVLNINLLTHSEVQAVDLVAANLFKAVNAAAVSVKLNKDKTLTVAAQPIDISDADATLLKNTWKSQRVIYLAANGLSVSGGLKWGVGMTTGLVTGILTGGAAIGMLVPRSQSIITVSFVDLDRKQLVWKKDLVDLSNSPLDIKPNERWAAVLMQPLIPLPTKK